MSRMRTLAIHLLCAGLAAVTLPAGALAETHRDYDWAEVLSATPVYQEVRVVTPRTECWVEQVVYERETVGRRSVAPLIVGATVGGVLGSEIGGKGRSRRVGTVVGAVLGGSIGHDIAHRHHDRRSRVRREVREEERCETRDVVTWEDRLRGYDVRYRYQGREYETHMDTDPGRQLRVVIHVSPVP